MTTVLVMRTCKADLISKNGFQWPDSGAVEAPDWKPTKECGNGLHGLLWGEGDAQLLNWSENAKWLVVEVEADSIIDLVGKVKFPRGAVVYCGDRNGAATLIGAHPLAAGKCIHAGTATAGTRGTATAGDAGTATAGIRGTATAGYAGTATAGDAGTATAGDAGVIMFRYWTGSAYRIAVGVVGENGIKANTPYQYVDSTFVEVVK